MHQCWLLPIWLSGKLHSLVRSHSEIRFLISFLMVIFVWWLLLITTDSKNAISLIFWELGRATLFFRWLRFLLTQRFTRFRFMRLTTLDAFLTNLSFLQRLWPWPFTHAVSDYFALDNFERFFPAMIRLSDSELWYPRHLFAGSLADWSSVFWTRLLIDHWSNLISCESRFCHCAGCFTFDELC
jgi:hypothetical protein